MAIADSRRGSERIVGMYQVLGEEFLEPAVLAEVGRFVEEVTLLEAGRVGQMKDDGTPASIRISVDRRVSEMHGSSAGIGFEAAGGSFELVKIAGHGFAVGS